MKIVTLLYRDQNHTEYQAKHVNDLYELISFHTSIDYEPFCITNDPSGLNENITVHLIDNSVKTWFNKLRIFDSSLFNNERILFIDLDMIPVSNLDDFLNFQGKLCMTKDPSRKLDFWSNLILFDAGNFHFIWDLFLKNKEFAYSCYGDQNWINALLIPKIFEEIYDFKGKLVKNISHEKFPEDTQKIRKRMLNYIVNEPVITSLPNSWFPSFKINKINYRNIPKETKIIVYHGKPRPWESLEEYKLQLELERNDDFRYR